MKIGKVKGIVLAARLAADESEMQIAAACGLCSFSWNVQPKCRNRGNSLSRITLLVDVEQTVPIKSLALRARNLTRPITLRNDGLYVHDFFLPSPLSYQETNGIDRYASPRNQGETGREKANGGWVRRRRAAHRYTGIVFVEIDNQLLLHFSIAYRTLKCE